MCLVIELLLPQNTSCTQIKYSDQIALVAHRHKRATRTPTNADIVCRSWELHTCFGGCKLMQKGTLDEDYETPLVFR